MTHIHLDFDEIDGVIERYRDASAELSSGMATDAPTHVEAGEASDAVAAVLIAVMEAGGMLAQYGHGLAADAEDAVDELRSFESSTVSALTAFASRSLEGDN